MARAKAALNMMDADELAARVVVAYYKARLGIEGDLESVNAVREALEWGEPVIVPAWMAGIALEPADEELLVEAGSYRRLSEVKRGDVPAGTPRLSECRPATLPAGPRADRTVRPNLARTGLGLSESEAK